MNTILINDLSSEKRMAVLKEQKLEKLLIEQPGGKSLVGGIFLGFVEKVLPGMNAAFVNIGLEKNGYLQRDKLLSYQEKKKEQSISSYCHVGERILVQVEKDATGDKGPLVTGLIQLTSEHLVYSPYGDYVAVSKKMSNQLKRDEWREFGQLNKQDHEGILFRTSAEQCEETQLLHEWQSLRAQFQTVLNDGKNRKKPALLFLEDPFIRSIKKELLQLEKGQIYVDTMSLKEKLVQFNSNPAIEILYYREKKNLFTAHHIQHEIDGLLQSIVTLKNGSYLVFDEAEALTMIDVNTGRFSGTQDRKKTMLQTNELAAIESSRQIILRELSGIILIDFMDMNSENERNHIKKLMQQLFTQDEGRTRVIGFTPLGILQLTRRKKGISIKEALTDSCQVCEGSGRVQSSKTMAYHLERELVELRGNADEAVLIECTSDIKEELTYQLGLLEDKVGLKFVFRIMEDNKPTYEIRKIGRLADLLEK